MSPITQNNKIALAAVSIFLASFAFMFIFMNDKSISPEYLKSSVIDSALSGGGSHGSSHSVPFSQSGGHESGGETVASVDIDAIKKTEDLYRILLNNFSDPFVVLEPNGKPKFLSSDFTEKYGYGVDAMSKKGFFSFINTEDLPDFVTEYTSVIQSGKVSQKVGPYRFIGADGHNFVHLISLLPVLDDDSHVTEVVGTVSDITSTIESFKTE